MITKQNKFYITTPIYYVNDKPHIGHTYTTVAADVLARYHRSLGDETFFLTGTDENSQKNLEAAKKQKKDVSVFTDEMAGIWRETWLSFGISFDRFIRTTSTEHIKAATEFFNRVNTKGDIYQGDYEGLYCVSCEEFKTENDLDKNGNCLEHKIKPKLIKEQNYFFKLSNYRDQLLEHIEQNPDFIKPDKRRNEVVSYIKDFMTDISISRQSMDWGITLPIDDEHKIYVWFDALLNYFSGIGYAQDEVKFQKFWPADVQLVGKDIIKFHCALWPAMLFSAGYSLPKTVFAHGHFTVNGDKMGKSMGNAIDPVKLSEEYSFDVIRYFLLREIPFGEDGDFSLTRLKERYNADLANDLGNLIQRSLKMIDQYLSGQISQEQQHDSPVKFDMVGTYLEDFKFDLALQEIWQGIAWANKFIDDTKPWELAKAGDTEKLTEVLARLYVIIKEVNIALEPFMPETSAKISEMLNADKLKAPEEPLFPRKS
jgi:methionyl-tRNA synthetase